MIASARGYYLRFWRYGRTTELLIEQATEREQWTADRWSTWQRERLAYILDRAATRVPYYREQWSARRRSGDKRSWTVLENWPLLPKQAVRDNPLAFVADDCEARRMYPDRTSGTTGTPLTIYLKRSTVRAWYALYEARIRRWNGVSIDNQWAIMGGQMIVPFGQQSPPFWVVNAGLRQLYLSTHHLSARNAPAYAQAIAKFRPTHMVVYPSSAAVLANHLLEQGLSLPRIKAVFTNAEYLSSETRDLISRAFNCPVRNTYGMGEVLAGASECPEGTMHLWPEAGILEVLAEDSAPVAPGTVGRFVGTGLFNPDMPLIRYEIGDRGSLPGVAEPCGCGRTLPALRSIEGRTNDLIFTADGRQVFWINPIFYGQPVKEAQVIQESLRRIVIKVVPGATFTTETEGTIKTRLRDRVGDVDVDIEKVAQIPRSANGKLRAVICNLTQEERQQALGARA
jgi:phenylacetate-CoA ligase